MTTHINVPFFSSKRAQISAIVAQHKINKIFFTPEKITFIWVSLGPTCSAESIIYIGSTRASILGAREDVDFAPSERPYLIRLARR